MLEIKGAKIQIKGKQKKPPRIKIINVNLRARNNCMGSTDLRVFSLGKIADVACPIKVMPARIKRSLEP